MIDFCTLNMISLKCPVCTESSHVSKWGAIASFEGLTYLRFTLREMQLKDESCMICPKCFKSSKYCELIKMQEGPSN